MARRQKSDIVDSTVDTMYLSTHQMGQFDKASLEIQLLKQELNTLEQEVLVLARDAEIAQLKQQSKRAQMAIIAEKLEVRKFTHKKWADELKEHFGIAVNNWGYDPETGEVFK